MQRSNSFFDQKRADPGDLLVHLAEGDVFGQG